MPSKVHYKGQTLKGKENRAVGALVGFIVGDALGTRYENMSSRLVRDMLQQELNTNGKIIIQGKGPHNRYAGQGTDDSEFCLTLARSLVKNKKYEEEHVAKNYHKWFLSNPCDLSSTIRNAFQPTTTIVPSPSSSSRTSRRERRKTHKNLARTICKNVTTFNFNNVSNVCLMRIPALSIFSIGKKREVLINLVRQDLAFTHSHEIALDAAHVFAVSLRSLILYGDARRAYRTALRRAKTKSIRRHLKEAEKKPEPILIEETGNSVFITTDCKEYQSYVGIALQNAFYELLHTENFNSALLNVICRGGDTDTNAAVTGALMGALHGFESIPFEWTTTVLSVVPEKRLQEHPDGATSDLVKLGMELYRI